jgi:hypothetical protein
MKIETPRETFVTALPVRRRLFLSWCDFSRRIASLDEHYGFEMHYVPSPVLKKWQKPFGYLYQFAKSAKILLTRRPEEVWLHCPPTFLPHLALMLRPFAGRYRIVADYHSGATSAKWNWVPGAIWAVNHCDLILLHNEEAIPQAEALGVQMDKTVMLEDPPPTRMAPAGGTQIAADRPPYVLAPCSFNPDEPIPLLLDAARLAPEIPILITGSKRRADLLGFTRDVPANVTFTDYLPLDEFERLLFGASVVFGLTAVEGIQLSVANEALGADKALVLSDTAILRSMFGAAAVLAKNTPEALAAGLREGIARREELEAKSRALKEQRIQDWLGPAETVTRRLA